MTTAAATSVTLPQPLLFQPLLFQGWQQGSKVTANLQMQVSKASPFPEPLEPCCGGHGAERWKGRLQTRQGNGRKRRTRGVPNIPCSHCEEGPAAAPLVWVPCTPCTPMGWREHPRESLLLLLLLPQGIAAGSSSGLEMFGCCCLINQKQTPPWELSHFS